MCYKICPYLVFKVSVSVLFISDRFPIFCTVYILNINAHEFNQDPKLQDNLAWKESRETWIHKLKNLKPLGINATRDSNHIHSHPNRSHKDQIPLEWLSDLVCSPNLEQTRPNKLIHVSH